MALFVDKARRQIRAVAQWLNLALETSGETQARILYQVLRFPRPPGVGETKLTIL